MVSGIRFFGASGSMGNTVASLYANGMATIGLEIFNFEISATDSPNRMGFFGSLGAPNSAVIVGQYQDRTHVTDHVGTDLGAMINAKFTGASTVEHSGVPFTGGFANIPSESGTLLARFTEPNGTAVITQSATFRAVNFDAGSGVPDIGDLATGITIQAAQLQDTAGNAADASWSEISSGGAALGLADQGMTAAVHDFHLLVSGNPSAAGRKINFGYYLQLEFL
jgi:hypothetical protein